MALCNARAFCQTAPWKVKEDGTMAILVIAWQAVAGRNVRTGKTWDRAGGKHSNNPTRLLKGVLSIYDLKV